MYNFTFFLTFSLIFHLGLSIFSVPYENFLNMRLLEKCTNGKIKRTWGARTRDVVCPVCGGSGVKPKRSEVKLVKFWFTAEGKYVANTLVDGIIRAGRGGSSGSKFSTNFSDYTVSVYLYHNNQLLWAF